MNTHIFCNKCGSKQIAGSKYCNNCGATIPEISQGETEKQKPQLQSQSAATSSFSKPSKALIRNLVLIAVFLFALVILGVLTFNLLNASSEPPAVAACIKTNTCEGYIDPETIEANNAEKAKKAELATSWVPEGFVTYQNGLAYKWSTGGSDPCGSIQCKFATLEVTSLNGCPGGLYVEVNFTSNGTVYDWSNDDVPSLSPGQVAQLQFVTYEDAGSSKVELATMSCH